jgi:hypothetical protein
LPARTEHATERHCFGTTWRRGSALPACWFVRLRHDWAVTASPEPTISSRSLPRPDCWLHEAIEVRRSAIEGQGLFARQDFPAGAVVARLGGRLAWEDELERLIADVERDPELPYVDSNNS